MKGIVIEDSQSRYVDLVNIDLEFEENLVERVNSTSIIEMIQHKSVNRQEITEYIIMIEICIGENYLEDLMLDTEFTICGTALIDTGCSTSKINKKSIPSRFHRQTAKPQVGMQMDGTYTSCSDIVEHVAVLLPNDETHVTRLANIHLRNLQPHGYLAILGLDFILYKNRFMIMTPWEVAFSCYPAPTDTMIRDWLKKRGGPIDAEKLDLNCYEDLHFNRELLEIETPCSDLISSRELNEIRLDDNILQYQSRLEKIGILGDNPQKFWATHKEEYKIEILDENRTIRGKAIPASNQELEWYKSQISELEKLGFIRKSESRHRSPSFFVNNHNEHVRGKARMVINYKELNDNTADNGYNIPCKDMLINKIQNAKVFSKFDCKSGYYQIRMHAESIEWTAFICPNPISNWEWLVVPFGLKNAPAVLQKRMDRILEELSNFVIVYIDDILVFSKNLRDHNRHLDLRLSLESVRLSF